MSEGSKLPARMPRQLITAILASHDIAMAAIAMEIAIWLRFAVSQAPEPFFSRWEATVIFAFVAGGVFYGLGLHRGVWRYTALSNLVAILKGVTLSVLIFLPALFLFNRLEAFPRSVALIVWPILIVLLTAPRFFYRLWTSGSLASLLTRDDPGRIPVLVAGLSAETDRFIRETQIDRDATMRVVGLLDANPAQTGRDIRGVRILGTPDDLDQITRDLEVLSRRPQKIILAPSALDSEAVRDLLDAANRLGIPLARLPRITGIPMQNVGRRLGAQLEPVAVTDLLGRQPKSLDRAAMRALVEGCRVMVTGAGGTIGSELCRQIAALEPRALALVDNGEFALYQIDLELEESHPNLRRSARLGDVRSTEAIERLIKDFRPDILFHAAAFKHVPLVEANACEGALTNVGGTCNVANACLKNGVKQMVLISTDKAVDPTSVMGATKRIAELYCQALEAENGSTRFVTVRFGNVLGSTGSVVPLFQHQLGRGGPLTVTHPDVSRYFMTTREAVELVLQAAALRVDPDGTPGHIFVLDMGEPVRIVDLARQMIRLAGLKPDIDVKIAFTGLRPGEKLHERLFAAAEPLVPTCAEGVLLACPRVIPRAALSALLAPLLAAATRRDEVALRACMKAIVPAFGTAPSGQEPLAAAGE